MMLALMSFFLALNNTLSVVNPEAIINIFIIAKLKLDLQGFV